MEARAPPTSRAHRGATRCSCGYFEAQGGDLKLAPAEVCPRCCCWSANACCQRSCGVCGSHTQQLQTERLMDGHVTHKHGQHVGKKAKPAPRQHESKGACSTQEKTTACKQQGRQGHAGTKQQQHEENKEQQTRMEGRKQHHHSSKHTIQQVCSVPSREYHTECLAPPPTTTCCPDC